MKERYGDIIVQTTVFRVICRLQYGWVKTVLFVAYLYLDPQIKQLHVSQRVIYCSARYHFSNDLPHLPVTSARAWRICHILRNLALVPSCQRQIILFPSKCPQYITNLLATTVVNVQLSGQLKVMFSSFHQYFYHIMFKFFIVFVLCRCSLHVILICHFGLKLCTTGMRQL